MGVPEIGNENWNSQPNTLMCDFCVEFVVVGYGPWLSAPGQTLITRIVTSWFEIVELPTVTKEMTVPTTVKGKKVTFAENTKVADTTFDKN